MTPILQDRRNLQRTLSNWKIDVVTRQGPPGDCYRFLWSKATHATLPSSEKEALLGIIPQFSSPCTLPPTSKTLCHDHIRIQKDKCQFIKFVKFNFLGWRANEEKKKERFGRAKTSLHSHCLHYPSQQNPQVSEWTLCIVNTRISPNDLLSQWKGLGGLKSWLICPLEP